MMSQHISIRRSLSYAGIWRSMWYHIKKPRNIPVDPVVSKMVQDIGTARPTCTRRMAAAVSRQMHMPVNRKRIRIFHRLGWTEPAKTKSKIVRSGRKLLRPTKPNQLWETDMTYWCGMAGAICSM